MWLWTRTQSASRAFIGFESSEPGVASAWSVRECDLPYSAKNSDRRFARTQETARFIIANSESVVALKRQDPVYAEAERVALFEILNPSAVQEERHKNPELRAEDERILRAFFDAAPEEPDR